MGVSVRRLMGWEPGEVTTFEYDGAGRLIRSVTIREPEFNAWDRALLLRSRFDEEQPRGSHGVKIADAIDPANQYRFRVPLPTTDFAARALDREQEKWEKQYGKDAGKHLLWRVELPD